MIRRYLPTLLFFSPTLLGALARFSEFYSKNAVLTATQGRVAPEEIATSLASGDLSLAAGFALNACLALVWLGRGWDRGTSVVVPRAAVALGLGLAALGSLQLQSFNRALAEDYRGTVVASSGEDKQAALTAADAVYRTTYSETRPVFASTQLARLVPGREALYQRADVMRLIGFLALVVGLVSSRRLGGGHMTPEAARADGVRVE